MKRKDELEPAASITDTRKKKKTGGLLAVTLAGTGVFWLASFLTSLLPLAAQYRAAYSNWSPQTVWIGAIFMGALFSFCLAYLCLTRLRRFLPNCPLRKALLIAAALLLIALALFDLPMMLRSADSDLHYFFVGVMFNAVRFLLMGLAVGAVCRRTLQSAHSAPSPDCA